MPVYEYECEECKKVFEVQQRISDDPLKTCPECEGAVKKLVSMSSFQLKGGGWYADGYASGNGKNGRGSGDSKPAETKSAPACDSGSAKCAGCPAASAS